MKTFDVLCKLRDGFDVFEEEEEKVVLTWWEKRQGLADKRIVRKRLNYEEEKKRAVAGILRYWEYMQHAIELILIACLQGKGANKLDVNANDRRGRAALSYAAADGHIQVISSLLRQKAKVDHKDNRGQTALFQACRSGHIPATAMLLCFGARPDVHDAFFTFPMHIVVEKKQETLMGMLIRAHASVNVYDSQGRTPLMSAMDSQSAAMVRRGIFASSYSSASTDIRIHFLML